MQAVTYNAKNDEFILKELEKPQVAGFDVLVKVHAVGLNPVDAKIHQWHEFAQNMNDNWVGGLDVSGEIVAIGDDVQDWKIGDKVLYHGNMFREHGGFAEFALCDSRTIIKHPNLTPIIASATPCAGWTAWRALVDKLRIAEHEEILILGGAGGTGTFAIQIAKYFGLKKIIVTASKEKHEFVKSLGATDVIDYKNADVVSEIMKLTDNQGVKIALDTVGVFDNDVICANCLAYEGQMVELVVTTRPEKYNDAFGKGLTFHQLSLGSGHRNGAKAQQDLVKAGIDFSKLVENGDIKIPELEVIELKQVGEKLKEMRNQRTVGKIVVNL